MRQSSYRTSNTKEGVTMILIKIPSPKIKLIYNAAKKNELRKSDVLDSYMGIVSNTLRFIGGKVLNYDDAEITERGFFAKVNIGSLPNYQDMLSCYGDLGLEEGIIERTERLNRDFGGECPVATSEALRGPIKQWDTRWVSIYIWVLLCCEHSDKKLCDDSVTSTALLVEFLASTIGITPNLLVE